MGNAKPYTDRQFQLSFMIIMSELLREKKKTVKKKKDFWWLRNVHLFDNLKNLGF